MSEGELKKRIREIGLKELASCPAETRDIVSYFTELTNKPVYAILDEAYKEFCAAKTLAPEKQPWDIEEEYSMKLKQLHDWGEKWLGEEK